MIDFVIVVIVDGDVDHDVAAYDDPPAYNMRRKRGDAHCDRCDHETNDDYERDVPRGTADRPAIDVGRRRRTAGRSSPRRRRAAPAAIGHDIFSSALALEDFIMTARNGQNLYLFLL